MMQLYTFQFTAGKDTEFLIILEGNRDARLLVLHDIESLCSIYRWCEFQEVY